MITVIMRMISFQDKFYVVKCSFALIPNLLNSIHICVIKKNKKKTSSVVIGRYLSAQLLSIISLVAVKSNV